MAKLTGIIPPQNYELVRDRIGFVLEQELVHQYMLAGKAGQEPRVWIERFVPIDHTELLMINVSLARGEYSGKDVTQANGAYTFNIDVYTSAPYTNASLGDTEAILILHRVIGMCRAILENPVYRTLDFAPPSIAEVRVSSIAIDGPVSENDSVNTARGRIAFEVMVPEGVELRDAPTLDLSTTRIKLHRTGRGYYWAHDGDSGHAFIDQEGGKFLSQDGLSHFAPNPEDHFIAQEGESFTSQEGEFYEHG